VFQTNIASYQPHKTETTAKQHGKIEYMRRALASLPGKGQQLGSWCERKHSSSQGSLVNWKTQGQSGTKYLVRL